MEMVPMNDIIILWFIASTFLGTCAILPALFCKCFVYHPGYIYKYSPCNKPASVIIAILLNLAFPVYAVIFWGVYLSLKDVYRED